MESRSDTPKTTEEGTETPVAKRQSESLAGAERLMEEVCELENCKRALQRVKANKGSPGVDGMTVDEIPEYLKQHGLEIGEPLRNGTYQPRPVKRVEIRKPDGQGVRKLRHSLCAGPLCSASSVAGSAEALGSDVLRTQPRFSDSGTDPENPRHQPAADGQGDRDLSARLARILRELSNALGVAKPRSGDTPPTPLGGVEAMEARTDTIPRASQTGVSKDLAAKAAGSPPRSLAARELARSSDCLMPTLLSSGFRPSFVRA